MKVDPTHGNEGRVSQLSQSNLRGVLEQTKLGSQDVLDDRLIFWHELRRVSEPSHVIIP